MVMNRLLLFLLEEESAVPAIGWIVSEFYDVM
jgi:hypothetical protein